jgi:hypothetical protein
MADPIQTNASYNYTPDFTPIDGPPDPDRPAEILECREPLAEDVELAESRPKGVPGNNAQRTTARTEEGFYADCGFTEDAIFAGVALDKNRDPDSGYEFEAGSFSLQLGGQNEAQAAAGRLGYTEGGDSFVVDLLTAKASGGAHNDDGSTGFNASAGATLLGAEGTLDLGDQDSLTFGLAASVGGGLSVGLRDGDHDGNLEFCFKASVAFLTVGACGED